VASTPKTDRLTGGNGLLGIADFGISWNYLLNEILSEQAEGLATE
jgi:hypothetical protein